MRGPSLSGGSEELLVGASYWLRDDGRIVAEEGEGGRLLGVAISPTELLLKHVESPPDQG